jgi:hypothetical protein
MQDVNPSCHTPIMRNYHHDGNSSIHLADLLYMPSNHHAFEMARHHVIMPPRRLAIVPSSPEGLFPAGSAMI